MSANYTKKTYTIEELMNMSSEEYDKYLRERTDRRVYLEELRNIDESNALNELRRISLDYSRPLVGVKLDYWRIQNSLL